jgi:hypothetical protein
MRLSSFIPLALCLIAVPTGCKSELPPPGPPKLVPVSGTITHDGKPLVGAIVQFNPSGLEGNISIGETDENGKYELSHVGFPGCSVGDYKVAVSLTMSTQGKPVTIGQQSSLSPHPAMLGAKEIIPKKFSSLGETAMTAKVTEKGGTFDFDIPGPFLDPPAIVEPAKDAAPAKDATPADPAKAEESPEAKAKMS